MGERRPFRGSVQAGGQPLGWDDCDPKAAAPFFTAAKVGIPELRLKAIPVFSEFAYQNGGGAPCFRYYNFTLNKIDY